MREVYVLIFGLLLLVQAGCHDVTVGYLETREAVYQSDSMIVKAELDPDWDARQIEFQIPWQSTSIEGVQGTAPIHYSIKSINSAHPEVADQFTMQGKGIIELPWNHTVPPGRYVINIRVSNEGYTYALDSVFTVVVK
ncbi:hypothetical protein [Butyricimonas hominis]|uniref:DUF4625 domain-containing protein n=1 Tax=Butyricimonas hominis TaxID=2763032 RepID=A0ABR7CW05_9BACT|nr:hypothetical protein [Butyricimonas hominis]MBC5619838.1 hypothetical protein [Butyricimonas hominis]